MLSNIVMKNLLFAAWKNSSQPKIGQFEYFTFCISYGSSSILSPSISIKLLGFKNSSFIF